MSKRSNTGSKSNTSGTSGPARSGGGATMNKNVRVPIRTGERTANKVSPGAVSQIGHAQGNHAMDKGTVKRPAEPLVTGKIAQPVPLGNAKALDVGGGGVGTGRTVHKSGSQATHGTPVQGSTPAPRDILSDFGREFHSPEAIAMTNSPTKPAPRPPPKSIAENLYPHLPSANSPQPQPPERKP